MRIAMVSEPLAGGVGQYVVELAKALHRRGHAVQLFHGQERVDRSWIDEIRAAGITTHQIGMGRNPSLGDAIAGWRLRRMLASKGPFDIIHAHSSKAGLLVRAAMPMNSHVLYTTHAAATLNQSASPAIRLAANVVERSLGLLTRSTTIAVSAEEHDHLADLGLPRLRLLENAVAIAEPVCSLDTRSRWRIERGELAVGFVGRFSSQKRPLLFVEIVEALNALGIRAVGIMTGEGELEAALRQRIEGSAARFVVEGQRADVRQLMGAFDCVCLPSAYEGFPLVLLEALAVGVPFVAAKVGGARAASADGRCGLVVETDAPDAYAQAIAAITERDRTALAVLCREHYERAFDHSVLISKTESLYRDILAQG